MSEFIVHSIPGSPYGRAVLTALVEKGASYRLAPLAMGAWRSEPHISRQPFGRVPAFEHDGFMLYETQAILRYLDRIIPSPPLTPAEPRAEARMNQVIGIADAYVMHDISSPIVFQRLIAPQFGMPVDEARFASALPKAKVCIDELGRLLGDHAYMAGDAVSIADLLLAAHLAFITGVDECRAMLAAQPRLQTWLDRMNARPSMIVTTPEKLMQAA
jgi:glutathione S-transferase